jgi:aspartate-semialdehyde dehydrogenase
MPEAVRRMEVLPSNPGAVQARIAFSALPSSQAIEVEPDFARAGTVVCSNASSYRTEPDVPLCC